MRHPDPGTVTLTRGRVQVRQGAGSQSWAVRDFRFVQLGHQAYPSKHLTLHTVSLWLVLDKAEGSPLLELLRYEEEEWLETQAAQYARVDAALAGLGLRERLAAPASETAEGADPSPR